MSAHTLGPWVSRPGDGCIFTDANGELVCTVQGGNWQTDEANARLIAAAPDLAEALQAMLIVHDHGECKAMHPDTAESMARAALAKAGVQS